MRTRSLPAALLLLALAAGCGGGDETPEVATGDPTAEEAMAPEPAPEAPPAQADEDAAVHRPAEIRVTISGDETYAGTYSASGTSRGCGVQTFMPGRPAYSVEFPYEGEFKITDLSFSAPGLQHGASTDSFRLSLGLETASGGRPPSFTLRAGSDPDESGTATLTTQAGTDSLVVRGTSGSATLEMTVVCRPKAG